MCIHLRRSEHRLKVEHIKYRLIMESWNNTSPMNLAYCRVLTRTLSHVTVAKKTPCQKITKFKREFHGTPAATAVAKYIALGATETGQYTTPAATVAATSVRHSNHHGIC